MKELKIICDAMETKGNTVINHWHGTLGKMMENDGKNSVSTCMKALEETHCKQVCEFQKLKEK